MRQRLEEPRQVRKEAAAFSMVVCCGVPGLFLYLLDKRNYHRSLLCLACPSKDQHKHSCNHMKSDAYQVMPEDGGPNSSLNWLVRIMW